MLRSSEVSRGRFFSGSPRDSSETWVSAGCSAASVTASDFLDATLSSCSRLRFFFGMAEVSVVVSVALVSCGVVSSISVLSSESHPDSDTSSALSWASTAASRASRSDSRVWAAPSRAKTSSSHSSSLSRLSPNHFSRCFCLASACCNACSHASRARATASSSLERLVRACSCASSCAIQVKSGKSTGSGFFLGRV